MKNKPTVAIGVPHASYFNVCKGFYVSLNNMLNFTWRHKAVKDIYNFDVTSPMGGQNRNKIAEMSLLDCDYMMQIDSDMTFQANTLMRMLKLSAKYDNKAVISGIAFMGASPHYPALYILNEGNFKPIAEYPAEPFEVDAVGSFGFLVPRKILEDIGEGPFDHLYAEHLEIRHDLAFCARVKKAGYKIICDPSIQFGHLRSGEVTEEDWLANKKSCLQ